MKRLFTGHTKLMSSSFTIQPALSDAHIAEITRLFRIYGASLEVDLTYQDFESELVSLPGQYANPFGALLIAHDREGRAVGCVGLRPLSDGVCEMKRLFVAWAGRSLGLGRALMESIIEAGRARGYHEMRLDTLPTMTAAQGLYLKAGFEPITPYYDTPVEGTVFMRLGLSAQD